MKKTLKTSLVALGLLAFGFAITSKVSAGTGDVDTPANADVNLTVQAGALTIGTSGASIDLGTVISTTEDVTLSGQFTDDSFYVSDLKGAEAGYYTTIQVTDLTGSINGETKTISSGNVSFKAGLNSPNLITGDPNDAVKFDDESKTLSAIDSAVQYIERTGSGGILGVYGDKPEIEVVVPAYTPATTYHGVITYTLYEN